MKPEDIAWCKSHIGMMALNGSWAVPRSGLIFMKTGEKSLALNATMPFMPEMAAAADEGRDVPGTADDLLKWQQEDYRCIASRFRAAGIEVTDKTGLMAEKGNT